MDLKLGQDDRVKFLCSFSGSVMPRPQDGKLRYVGGETRMVSLSRFTNFEQLLNKMKGIYISTSLIKYQQPDEDLDALVSIVNDDDVMHMMEEHDKLNLLHSVDRLRIFLFSILDSGFQIEAKELGLSRYLEALNDQDLLLLQQQQQQQQQFNLRNVAVPRSDQRYNTDSEGGFRSPVYCSPTTDFTSSPSSPPRFSEIRAHNLTSHGCENCRMNLQRKIVLSEELLNFQQHASLFSDNMSPSNREIGGFFNNYVLNPQSRASNFSNYDHYHHYHHDVLHEEENSAFFGHFPHTTQGSYHRLYPAGPTAVRATPESSPRFFLGKEGQSIGFDEYSVGQSSRIYPNHHLFTTTNDDSETHDVLHEEDNSTFFSRFPHTCRVDCTSQGSYHHLHPAGPAAVRGTPESSPRFFLGKEGQNIGFDGYAVPNEYSVAQSSRIYPNIFTTTNDSETQYFSPLTTNPSTQTCAPQQLSRPSTPRGIGEKLVSSGLDSDACVCDDKNPENGKTDRRMGSENEKRSNDNITHLKEGREYMVSCSIPKHVDEHPLCPVEGSTEGRRSLHEISDSVKEMSLRDCKEPKNDVRNGGSFPSCVPGEDILVGVETVVGVSGDKDVDSGNEQSDMSKIEPTEAEEEALSRGLQTIKNDDLEEIRELGSGTYGAVYHGKWRGSDVAVKRIKASCFSGKPSERERLITDFWKEALILSSLHHPNVVSFYGIVRDGPDGSLATVTEFMINGSLKQFLHKKDRTVDRRKRLIIGMDVAFGMEYLHGKNIVHFDLKCENLLVNMRDPQRPICKIGDLGLSKVKRNTLVSGGVRGTLPWMAPELLRGKNGMVTEKIDVYSFGIVMWELLTGEDPYTKMHCASIIGGIVNNELRPEIPTWCDPEWKCLMESCWASEPAQRPSFSHISHKLRTMGAAFNLK